MSKEECKCPLCSETDMEDGKTYECILSNVIMGRGDYISPEQVIDYINKHKDE